MEFSCFINIFREDLQSKFFYEINKVIEDSRSVQKLYGWGNNNAGQLALPGGAMTVKIPQQIPLPEFYEKEEILKIECGFKCSALLTNLGRVFISEPEESKGGKPKAEKSDVKEEKGKEKKSKGDKQPKEEDEALSKKKPKTHRWDDMTIVSINPK